MNVPFWVLQVLARAHVEASSLMKAFTPMLRSKHPSSGPHMRVGAF
jgi:hypothetical protein